MKLENPKPEELILLEKQLDNSDFCIYTTMRWMWSNPRRTDFDEYNIDCGTYGCVLGWYSMQRYGKTFMKSTGAISEEDWVSSEFGIDDWDQRKSIFGISCFGTLYERKSRLIKHRDHLQAKIAAFTPVSAGSVAA